MELQKKLKVLTVVGTRPEIIRLSRVIAKLDQSKAIEHILVHSGQNYDYELNEIFFEDLELRKPDYFLNAAGKNATETIGQIIINIESILENEKPDAFLVLGDTNSCLCAIPAKKKKIPIFHMEAGNRCFDQRVPEETNRRIVDHISDINLTYSNIAREYLLREGLPPDRIIKTGSPMFEVIHYYLDKIEASNILETLGLKRREYFVVSAHREENINSERLFFKWVSIIEKLAQRFKYPVVVSTHPRTKKMLQEKGVELSPLIKLLKPFSFSEYNKLQKESYAVLSDSGTISEEASILNFSALNIREAHERPEAMEETSVMMVGMNEERILQALELIHYSQEKIEEERTIRIVSDYSTPNVAEKVIRIIISYVDYINLKVWGKE